MKRAAAKVAKEIAHYLNGKGDTPAIDYRVLQGWILALAPPRKKPIRRSKTSLKSRATVKELDALCREIVFERGNGACLRCDKPAVDWSHVYSRRFKWLRWELDNSWPACKGCHLWWHHKPMDAGAWYRGEIGPKRFDALVLRASKPRKVSPELVKAYLEQERKKL